MESTLIGYVRASKSGKALRLSVLTEAFENAKSQSFKGKDGREMVGLVINVDNMQQVLNGTKDVTNLSQIIDEPAAE